MKPPRDTWIVSALIAIFWGAVAIGAHDARALPNNGGGGSLGCINCDNCCKGDFTDANGGTSCQYKLDDNGRCVSCQTFGVCRYPVSVRFGGEFNFIP